MPGRPRLPLAEALQLLEREVVAGQVEDGVLEHRRVAGREDEAVAVRPARVGRVVPQHAPVEHVGQRRERHRRPGWPALFAFCTASIASALIVSIDSFWIFSSAATNPRITAHYP